MDCIFCLSPSLLLSAPSFLHSGLEDLRDFEINETRKEREDTVAVTHFAGKSVNTAQISTSNLSDSF